MTDSSPTHAISPIGYVRRGADGVLLEILPAYRPALLNLGHFSHVIVLWWLSEHDNPESRARLQTAPAYTPEILSGVFALRAPFRPNPIALTTCKILSVDEGAGIVRVASIDAFDGSEIIDLKAYFPASDRVRAAHIPPWLKDWPEWMPEDGLGL